MGIKVDPSQPLHYSNERQWSDIASPCTNQASNSLSWLASPFESDDPLTSDLSPVSGYFDWSHSSNNTSPAQYDGSLDHPSPDALLHTRGLAVREGQSLFVTNYPISRQSCDPAPEAVGHQNPERLVAAYPAPAKFMLTTERSGNGVSAEPKLLSSNHKPASGPTAGELAECDELPNSRGGKRWKAAHRAVERRYRSNLNLKIIQLGQCIPAIRHQITTIEDFENGDDTPNPKAKLQKGHVLSRAVDYIQSLQQHVSELEADKRRLESKVEALQEMIGGCITSQEVVPCRQVTEVPQRFSGQQSFCGSRARRGLTSAVKDERRESADWSSEAQAWVSTPQTETPSYQTISR